jgi:GTP-binding protein EngB required for normal cell division
MKIAISLNKNIECDYICKQIQSMVNNYQQSSQDISRAVLVIDIINVTDSIDNLMPKIEYKPDCNS